MNDRELTPGFLILVGYRGPYRERRRAKVAPVVELDVERVRRRPKRMGRPSKGGPPSRTCVVCGKPFATYQADQRACSRRCGGTLRRKDFAPAPHDGEAGARGAAEASSAIDVVQPAELAELVELGPDRLAEELDERSLPRAGAASPSPHGDVGDRVESGEGAPSLAPSVPRTPAERGE